MVCLSKGLAAPVGSMLAGPVDLIEKARKWRKLLGGGMRQAGVLAAAGFVAVQEMTARLADDHALARELAAGLQGTKFRCDTPETNIVIVDTRDSGRSAEQVSTALEKGGVLTTVADPVRVRFVTHCDVGAEAVRAAVDMLRRL
jgi:threonine aldolase